MFNINDLFGVFNGDFVIHNARNPENRLFHLDMLMKLTYFKEFVIPYVGGQCGVSEEEIAERQLVCDAAIRQLVAACMAQSDLTPYDLDGDIDTDAVTPLVDCVSDFMAHHNCQCPECLSRIADEVRDNNAEDYFGSFVEEIVMPDVAPDEIAPDDQALYPSFHDDSGDDLGDAGYDNDAPSDDDGGGDITIKVQFPKGW